MASVFFMSLSDNKKDNFSQAAVFDSCVDVNIYTILYRKAGQLTIVYTFAVVYRFRGL